MPILQMNLDQQEREARLTLERKTKTKHPYKAKSVSFHQKTAQQKQQIVITFAAGHFSMCD
jgi:hypothetical protein